ncbi:MAG: ABC transporter ATP-binding protein [Candidatus Hodarchaeales archaeon]|jgi:ATP-binding cassette subfamily B protein
MAADESIDEKTLTLMKPTSERRYRSGNHLFYSFFWKKPSYIIFSLVMNVFSSTFTIAPAVLTGMAIGILDDPTKGFGEEFIFTGILIIVSGILFLIFSFLANYSFAITAFAYERDVRQEFFDVIQSHSMTFHNEYNSSKLLSMGMTEISQMRMGLHPSMRMLSQTLFSMLLTVLLFFETGTFYGLIISIGTPLYFFFAYRYARKIGPIRNQLANEIGSLTESCQEVFRGIEVVRGFSEEAREKENFIQRSRRYATLAQKEGRMQAFYLPGLVLIAMTVIVFSVGLIDLSVGVIGVDELVEAVGLLLSLQFLNFMLPMVLLNIQASLINAGRIWKILNWMDPQPDVAIESPTNINWKTDIHFENVTFSYNTGAKPALKNINLTIPAGSKVALIGGPGSGKSTFLKLILRLYDPQEGKILIDDKQDYVKITAEEIRRHCTMVEQEIFLFSAPIKENIAFSKPDADEEEIIEVAKAAQAHEFVDQIPGKYDSVIGERGVTLSGGQRQRLAIARALLADPEILLLDDSVSAVDSKTELLLQRALDRLRSDRTSIEVTQRLVTLVNADIVVLLEKGELVAAGHHEDLLETCPQYQRIFKLLPKSEQIIVGGVN